ncbi:unnamed protein product [Closterium sp. NIES-54]
MNSHIDRIHCPSVLTAYLPSLVCVCCSVLCGAVWCCVLLCGSLWCYAVLCGGTIQEPRSVEKIMEVDSHIGAAMSGLTADARTLIHHGRIQTQSHRFSYNEPMLVESCTQALCDLSLKFGEGGDDSMVSWWRQHGELVATAW